MMAQQKPHEVEPHRQPSVSVYRSFVSLHERTKAALLFSINAQ
jgi:hypothetical protein